MRFAASAWLLCGLAAAQEYDLAITPGVKAPMRDGVRLVTDLYRPARDGVPVDGRFPVLLERTPYDRGRSRAGEYFARRGYVVVVQSVRGRYGSEGKWSMLWDDDRDGFDTAQWILKQPWCDGGIGTMGTSYAGGTQHAMAIANAPGLKAMIPVDALSNTGQYGMRHNGAFELRFFNWIFTHGNAASSNTLAGQEPDPARRAAIQQMAEQIPDYLRNLPLRPGMTPLRMMPEYETWLVEAMRHGENDEWWKKLPTSVVDRVGEYKDIPVFHVTGWYDSWGSQVANLSYPALSKSKKSLQKLIIGPWTHGGQTQSYAGEAEFGPDAGLDFNALRLRWFDRWLRNMPNQIESEPPVRIFVMGTGNGHRTPEGRVFVGGYWRDEREWPVARAKPVSLYFWSGGVLSEQKPRESAPTRFTFDPRDPVPTIGGNVSSSGVLMFPGAFDQRCRPNLFTCKDQLPLSARRDVVVFQTPPLEADLEVTGSVEVNLFASTSAPDTDFTAKLVDVHPPSAAFPNGVDLNIADSIVRGRFREPADRALAVKPGAVHAYTIRPYPTSLIFRKGHRIRIDISSSNFPRFDVNPNTGEPLNQHRRMEKAEQAIYHDPQYASRVVLPVIPK
ncbi:MAG: CocE/NonD family hydrolase [Bryobacteraceae bacterium]|nr:CocE/NonD family hydrolase [Bryobacteraceae bacterium]